MNASLQPEPAAAKCSHCGAPLATPPEQDAVSCAQCGARSDVRRTAEAAPVVRPASSATSRRLALALGALTLVVAAGGVGMYLKRRALSPFDARVTADMPLEPGDQVTVDLGEHRACTGSVLAIADDQRIAVEGCTPEFTLLDRSRMRIPKIQRGSLTRLEGGDLVLVGAPNAWRRRQVVGPAPGGRLQLRGYGASANIEEQVSEEGVLLVRPRSAHSARLWTPVPEGLPLEKGDLVVVDIQRGVLATRSYALVTGGDPLGGVDLQPVVIKDGMAADSYPAEKAVPRTRVRAEVLRFSDYVRPDDVIAVRSGGAWTRWVVVRDAERGNAVVKPESGGGGEQTVEKAGALRLRGTAD